MYSIIVKNKVKPGCKSSYLKAMLENAKRSVEDEEGCIVFDVLEAQQEEDCFYLYEIYKDKASVAVHKETPHYLESRKRLSDLIIEQSVIRADVIATH